MNPQTDPSALNADAINQRVKASVKAYRIKLGVLTTAAFVLGFAAMITSLLLVWSYPVFVLPRQRELPLEAMKLMDQLKTNTITSRSGEDAGNQIVKLLAAQVETSNVTTAGTVVLAAAVGLLGLGTLILLTVVILNRRVALNQINASLAGISGQLRELQKTHGSSRIGAPLDFGG
jgi:hypothetical protein